MCRELKWLLGGQTGKFPLHGNSIQRVFSDWLAVAKTVYYHDLLSLHDDVESKSIFKNGVLWLGSNWVQNHKAICVGRDL